MAKKLLALIIAMCMVFSVCAINVFAEGENTDINNEATEPTEETESTEEETEEETQEETDEETQEETDEEEEKAANFSLSNAYLPNASVTIKGTVTGGVSVVRVEIIFSN